MYISKTMDLRVTIFMSCYLVYANGQQCHIQGEVNGVLDFAHVVTSYNECLDYCKVDPACSCFTHYEDIGECVGFSEYLSLDNTCTTCLSGERDCAEYQDCDIDGFCRGTLVDITIADSEADCLVICQANVNCTYYAYQEQDGSCALLKDCNDVDPCTGCHSGERTCSISSPGNLTILMVVGGYPASAYYDVELIDMTGQGRTCKKPDVYPGAEYGSVGAFLQDRAIVCGGYSYLNDSYLFTSQCYYYNKDGTWTEGPSMIEERAFAADLVFDGQLWVAGGRNSAGNLNSTEVFDSSGDSFSYYVDMPEARYTHNIVALGDNRTMLVGGQDRFHETYIFSTGAWQEGPRMSIGRDGCEAGVVKFNNGSKAVVAVGGYSEKTTEYLNDDENFWRLGPELPYYIYKAASVQLENTFFFVGGFDGTYHLDTIWGFDVEAEQWTLLNETLATPRDYTTAFLLPDDFC